MGILGYPNMDDNNHDGIFGDYSDIYSNYPEEGNNADNVAADAQQAPVEGVGESVVQEEAVQEIPGQNFAPQKKSGGSKLYFLVMLLLLVVAAGLYYYKMNVAPGGDAQQEQSMGDYFYDQATGADGAASQGDVATATVDVDLTSPAASQADGQAVQPQESADKAKVEPADKPLTALEKAELKKKQDEQKENQVGLSSRPVIVPVSAGGRVDPFMPYYQQQAISQAPKFELIAPPATIPDADPVIDELFETKISGIMYDPARPSAIVNFGGNDQLVHKGDVVKGYTIVNITKDCVVIKYKSNIYQATVGQSLNDGVNLNPVSNLTKSFGGAYSKTPNNVIKFNN